jgi:predicted nucleic acid-binding protein
MPEPLPTVLDASVGVALAHEERASAEIAAQIRDLRRSGGRLLVPSLFWLEVVNVLARRYRAPAEGIVEAVAELEAMGIETVDVDRPMLLLAIDAVVRHGLTAYDAAYLTLADVAGARLLTTDELLALAVGDRAIYIGRRRRMRELPERYRATPDWATWPGAAQYLRELRDRARQGEGINEHA